MEDFRAGSSKRRFGRSFMVTTQGNHLRHYLAMALAGYWVKVACIEGLLDSEGVDGVFRRGLRQQFCSCARCDSTLALPSLHCVHGKLAC